METDRFKQETAGGEPEVDRKRRVRLEQGSEKAQGGPRPRKELENCSETQHRNIGSSNSNGNGSGKDKDTDKDKENENAKCEATSGNMTIQSCSSASIVSEPPKENLRTSFRPPDLVTPSFAATMTHNYSMH